MIKMIVQDVVDRQIWAWCARCWIRTTHEVRHNQAVCVECGKVLANVSQWPDDGTQG